MTYSTRRSALGFTAEKSPTSTRPSDNNRPSTSAATILPADQDPSTGSGQTPTGPVQTSRTERRSDKKKRQDLTTRRHPTALEDAAAAGRPSAKDLQPSFTFAAIEPLEGREYMSAASIGLT